MVYRAGIVAGGVVGGCGVVVGGGGYNGNKKNGDINRGNETFGLP